MKQNTDLCFLIIAGMVAFWCDAVAADKPMTPTLTLVRDERQLLRFDQLSCPVTENGMLWQGIISDHELSRDHRLAALAFAVLRHGNNKSIQDIQRWTYNAGLNTAWGRLRELGGHVPIRKLDLEAGVYRLRLKLKRSVTVSMTIQLNKNGTIREAAALIFDGNNVRRLLRSCD